MQAIIASPQAPGGRIRSPGVSRICPDCLSALPTLPGPIPLAGRDGVPPDARSRGSGRARSRCRCGATRHGFHRLPETGFGRRLSHSSERAGSLSHEADIPPCPAVQREPVAERFPALTDRPGRCRSPYPPRRNATNCGVAEESRSRRCRPPGAESAPVFHHGRQTGRDVQATLQRSSQGHGLGRRSLRPAAPHWSAELTAPEIRGARQDRGARKRGADTTPARPIACVWRHVAPPSAGAPECPRRRWRPS